jgi:DNA repair protein RadC
LEGHFYLNKMKQNEQVAEIEISYRPAVSSKPIVTSSLDAYNAVVPFFPTKTIAIQEKFVAMYLNRANRVLGVFELSKGGITGTVVDIRLLISVALKVAASSIILAHNHPSGNLQPSSSDRQLTDKIKSACNLFDVTLTDHLIISPNETFLSFSDEGFI